MLDLPFILTDAEVTTYAALIALLVGIVQAWNVIPIPEGSRTRAIAISLLAALFVGLAASSKASELAGGELIIALVFSFAALASASLGLNRAGTFATRQAATTFQSPSKGSPGDTPR